MTRLVTSLFGTQGSGWQVRAAGLVLIGAAVTIAYAVVDNFWG
jgi:hypothetical protein